MIEIGDDLMIPEDEIVVTFIRSSGPGGQNVNKVSSAVQLRFDARNSPSLTDPVRARLETIAGSRLTKAGEIVITANRHRTQEANRRDAIARLTRMLEEALIEPKPRKPTRPSRAAKKRRLESKARRSSVKRLRGKVGQDE